MRKNIRERAIFILLIISLTAVFISPAQAADTKCVDCQQKTLQSCVNQCRHPNVSHSQEYPCYLSCQRRACSTICSEYLLPPYFAKRKEEFKQTENIEDTVYGQIEANSERDVGDMSCRQCLKYKEHRTCANLCSGEEDIYACRKKCAKRECAQRCQLPGLDGDAKPRKKVTKRDCTICKRTAKSACRDQCGNDQERAGYVACIVSCSEERCLRTCNPDLF
jgi:hypothetical protein